MRIPLEKLFVSKDSSIIKVIEFINENLLKTAFIVDDERRLLGIVTDGDIRRAILKDISLNSSISTIMKLNPYVIKSGLSESKILQTMVDKVIQIIPVLDERKRIVQYYHITDFIKEKFLKNNIKKDFPSKKSKQILVTGGAGYIGSTLVRMLLKNGYNVRVLDNLMFGEYSIEDLYTNPNFEFIRGDYTNIEDIIPCLKDVEAIIHLAAIVGDPAGNIDPELTEEINYYGVKILAELCKYYKIQRFIFVSTCSVYGASKSDLLEENSPLNPVSLYAETKYKAESELLKIRDSEFCPCILRLATVFGLSFRMRFDLVINLLTALAVKKKQISIFSGEQWRPFVHVKDVGKAIVNILNQPIHKITGEIFNIGSVENNYQIRDIGVLMKKIFPEITITTVEEKEDERSYRVSFKKMKEILRFKPKYSIEYGIKEIAEFLKNEDVNIKDSNYSNFKKVQLGVFDSIYFAE